MTELKANVTVEKAIRDAIRDFANNVFKKHGVRIDGVKLAWVNISGADEIDYLLNDVKLDMDFLGCR